MVNEQQNISKLDASMIRCGVSFIFSYHFTGTVDEEKLRYSVKSVLSNVPRLQRSMITDDQYQAEWHGASLIDPKWFISIYADFGQALTQVYQDVVSSWGREYPPMFFVFVQHPKKNDRFMLIQCGQHSYCDGSGATLLFNQVLKYYNASLSADSEMQTKIKHGLNKLISPAPDEIYSLKLTWGKKWLDIGRWSHINNTVKLITYKTVDSGQFSTPYKELPSLLTRYQNTIAQPQKHYFDIKPLILRCEEYSADISHSNMIFALVAKAMFRVNQQEKKLTQAHHISFRVMMDILNVGLRKKIFGNYITYLPVIVDARQSVEHIAVDISQRLYQAKCQRQDVSMYKMLEFALSSGMANKANDPVSYIIANTSNVAISNDPYLMRGAKFKLFEACANAAPIDIKGAQLNNRPTLCFNLSKVDKLYLGFFNTVTDPKLNKNFIKQVNQVLAELTISTETLSNK